MFHTKHADLIDPGNIVAREDDTDMAIILSCNVEKLENSHLWYDFEVDYNNSRKYIDITELAKNMKIIKWLPGIYAFIGNDHTPAFFKKGKIRPIQLMQKNENRYRFFENRYDLCIVKKQNDDMRALNFTLRKKLNLTALKDP